MNLCQISIKMFCLPMNQIIKKLEMMDKTHLAVLDFCGIEKCLRKVGISVLKLLYEGFCSFQ